MILSPDFKNKDVVAHCSVVTGTVLGGAFIGFGAIANYRSVDAPNESSASVKIFSYIAQGVIPTTSDTNLWAAYVDWKKKLLSELHSGFPKALQIRGLSDVLKENKLLA